MPKIDQGRAVRVRALVSPAYPSLVHHFAHARLDGKDGEFLDGGDLLPLLGHRQRQVRLYHARLEPVRGRAAGLETIDRKFRLVQIVVAKLAKHTFWDDIFALCGLCFVVPARSKQNDCCTALNVMDVQG